MNHGESFNPFSADASAASESRKPRSELWEKSLKSGKWGFARLLLIIFIHANHRNSFSFFGEVKKSSFPVSDVLEFVTTARPERNLHWIRLISEFALSSAIEFIVFSLVSYLVNRWLTSWCLVFAWISSQSVAVHQLLLFDWLIDNGWLIWSPNWLDYLQFNYSLFKSTIN